MSEWVPCLLACLASWPACWLVRWLGLGLTGWQRGEWTGVLQFCCSIFSSFLFFFFFFSFLRSPNASVPFPRSACCFSCCCAVASGSREQRGPVSLLDFSLGLGASVGLRLPFSNCGSTGFFQADWPCILLFLPDHPAALLLSHVPLKSNIQKSNGCLYNHDSLIPFQGFQKRVREARQGATGSSKDQERKNAGQPVVRNPAQSVTQLIAAAAAAAASIWFPPQQPIQISGEQQPNLSQPPSLHQAQASLSLSPLIPPLPSHTTTIP